MSQEAIFLLWYESFSWLEILYYQEFVLKEEKPHLHFNSSSKKHWLYPEMP